MCNWHSVISLFLSILKNSLSISGKWPLLRPLKDFQVDLAFLEFTFQLSPSINICSRNIHFLHVSQLFVFFSTIYDHHFKVCIIAVPHSFPVPPYLYHCYLCFYVICHNDTESFAAAACPAELVIRPCNPLLSLPPSAPLPCAPCTCLTATVARGDRMPHHWVSWPGELPSCASLPGAKAVPDVCVPPPVSEWNPKCKY